MSMLPIITDFQLVCCGVATVAAAVGYGLTRNSPYRIPLQLPSPSSLPRLDLAGHALTRIRLGKRKRSASSLSDASASTLTSTSDTSMTLSDTGESEIISDEAALSPPTTVYEEDGEYVVVESPYKKRRSHSPERNVDESSSDMKVDEPSIELVADRAPAPEEEPHHSVDTPIVADPEAPVATVLGADESEPDMTRAVDLMSHPVPESSMDDATPISTPLPSNSEEASKDTSETTQSSITEFSSSPKRDAPSTDGILAFSAPQPAAAAAATTTTTITPSPAWGSASSWGVKCASTVPSAFSTRTLSTTATAVGATTPNPAWGSASSWAAKPASAIPSAISATTANQANAFSAFTSSQPALVFGVKRARDSDDPKASAPAWRTSAEEKEPKRLSSPAALRSEAEPEEALAKQTHETSSHNYATGEEDETVVAEVKGVKLLVKRGSRDFVDCSRGHIKLLSSNDPAGERLVFRREQVLKLGMNVRLRPTVRCGFSEEDGVLRVILKEPKDAERKAGEEVVIYALKAGTASKKEFSEFASMVTLSPHLEASYKP